MALCDVWKLFSYLFLWGGDLKIQLPLKSERCEHRDDTSIVDGDQVGVKCCLLYWKSQWRRCPLGGIELCHCSSCVWSLSSLLNTERIVTLPMFLLSDGSLIWMWSTSFAWWCRVLLSVYYCKIFLSSALGVLRRCGGFWWHWWFYFYGLKLFQRPVG